MSDYIQEGGIGASPQGAPTPTGPTTTSTGEPAGIYAPLATPDQQPDVQQQPIKPINLDDYEEFRRYKGVMERQRQEMQSQLQATQAQLAQIEAANKQAQFEARLRQARTVDEQAAIHQERLQEQAIEIETKAVEQQDVANLHDWENVYVQEWGIPPQAMGMINQVAELDATDPQGNFDLGAFHHRRDALAKMARSYYVSYQGQPRQPQQPTRPQYAPQTAARPTTGASPSLSGNEMVSQAMRDNSEEDWRRVKKFYRLR